MDLEARILVLERRHRRLRHLFLLTVVLLASAVLVGQAAPAPETIEAGRFVLRDASGVERALLGLSPSEEVASLVLRNREGETRVLLSHSQDGTSTLTMINDAGKAQLVARVRGTGSASVRLADEGGIPRAKLGVSETGSATVGLIAGRRSIAAMTLEPGGSTRLSLNDAEGRTRARIAVAEDGAAEVATFDREGNRLDR